MSFSLSLLLLFQVSLQFSPPTVVPSEGNVLTVSAQAGSLCGLNAVGPSVRIMEPGRRLSAEAVFNLLPVRSLSDYPYPVEDEQECLNVRPRRPVPTDQAYEVFKSVGMKVATNLPVQEPHCLMYRGLNYYRNFYRSRSS
ncbi:alpha-1-macroglobulin-like, partial [Sinocyclocheilus rhinocerous]|uniref:alpha-1-macroglobulin-like n=1 Tax=Sinocyclocheilus rhinocerous TaxID=307959 RepID=UPI0007B8BBE0